MVEKFEDNQIESGLSSKDLDKIKKQLEDLKGKFETNQDSQEVINADSINTQISNLESFINGENINIDQAKELLSDIVNNVGNIENKNQQEYPQNKLDNFENIGNNKKDIKPNTTKQDMTQIDISHLSDQRQIDHYVTAQADIVRDRYDQEVSEDAQEIGAKIPWLKRLVDKAS